MTITDDTAWAAVMRRDRTYDGRFVTGVLTTGIYCRPSCAARHPARANVRFFASGAEARDAGLRACKRCLPDDVTRDEAAVAAAVDEIKASEGKPTPGEQPKFCRTRKLVRRSSPTTACPAQNQRAKA